MLSLIFAIYRLCWLKRRWLVVALPLVSVGTWGTLIVSPAPAAGGSDCRNGYVALTFDDGPNSYNTMKLLAALSSAGLRATLFNVGRNVERYPEVARAEVDAGMWIANHSWSHPHLADLRKEEVEGELTRTQEIVQEITGTVPVLFRAPYVETSDTIREVAQQLGLTVVPLGVNSGDWQGADTEQIVDTAWKLDAGDVMVMHDRKPATVDAIPEIARILDERGLCTGTISAETGRAAAPRDQG